jgi:hypothetical protein
LLNAHDVPKLTQEGINYSKGYIMNNEIESVVKIVPAKKSAGPDECRPNILPDLQKRISTNIPQSTPKKIKKRNTTKFILQSQYYPDLKTR